MKNFYYLFFVRRYFYLFFTSCCSTIWRVGAKSSIWSLKAIWDTVETVDPLDWWRGNPGRRELTKFAIIVLSLPCTSAASERNWSDFGNLKTKKRNELAVERTSKIIAVKSNLDLRFPEQSKQKKRPDAVEEEYDNLNFDNDSDSDDWDGEEFDNLSFFDDKDDDEN